MKVYIVLGEHNDHSDRSVFVSGVFATKEEAEKEMRLASDRRRAWLHYWEGGPKADPEAADCTTLYEAAVGVWNVNGIDRMEVLP